VTLSAGFIPFPFSDLSEADCDWEKAIQIADMALYLCKAHGRNRAYGVLRTLVQQDDLMFTLEHDLAQAIAQKYVEICEVIGPTQKPNIE